MYPHSLFVWTARSTSTSASSRPSVVAALAASRGRTPRRVQVVTTMRSKLKVRTRDLATITLKFFGYFVPENINKYLNYFQVAIILTQLRGHSHSTQTKFIYPSTYPSTQVVNDPLKTVVYHLYGFIKSDCIKSIIMKSVMRVICFVKTLQCM